MQAAILLLCISAVAAAGGSASIATASEAAGPDTAVVCPAEFRAALDPWLEFRRGEGRQIQLIASTGAPEEIRARIRAAARQGTLRHVLLVGGANPRGDLDTAVRGRSVAVHLEPAKVTIRWGSEAQIAADDWYADLDGDGVPDVAIGRLTVESAAELAVVVHKILAYERQADFQAWRTRVNLVAGVGGFSPMIDAVVETSARQLIASGLPAGYETSLTYANWRSPCCPDPRQFHATTMDRLNEGCLFWVYMGHGRRTGLDRMRTPAGAYPILDRGDVNALHCAAGSPIAIFLACYTGAFDAPQRCLADEMLRTEGAPVAVVCGSRVTMPYGMTVFGAALLGEVFDRHSATIGEAVLHAKRRSVDADGADGGTSNRWLIDTLAGAVSPPNSDLSAERREHVHLFNLLGDPLLRLRYPEQAVLQAPRVAGAGERITVSGWSTVEGLGNVKIVAARGATAGSPRQQFDSSAAALSAYQQTYRAANESGLCEAEVKTAKGQFSVTLDIPRNATGHFGIRAFVAGDSDCALGTAELDVHGADALSAR